MLVLTRKVNQAIVIADKVRVVVAEVEGNKVRLGVDAPRNVTVDREELHLLKRRTTRGPPEVFTQQEYDALADHARCEPATFCGRRMYVREGPPLAQVEQPLGTA
jgi:carbon storage regulator